MVEQSAALTVNKLIEAKQELAMLDEHSVNAVHAAVDERTKDSPSSAFHATDRWYLGIPSIYGNRHPSVTVLIDKY